MPPKLNNIQYRQLTLRQIYISGCVLIIVGLFMTVLMCAVAALLLDIISLSDIIPGTYMDESSGPAETSIPAFVFVGFCLVFGLASMAAGIYQVWTGKRSRKLMWVILIMGAIFFAAGMIVRGLS